MSAEADEDPSDGSEELSEEEESNFEGDSEEPDDEEDSEKKAEVDSDGGVVDSPTLGRETEGSKTTMVLPDVDALGPSDSFKSMRSVPESVGSESQGSHRRGSSLFGSQDANDSMAALQRMQSRMSGRSSMDFDTHLRSTSKASASGSSLLRSAEDEMELHREMKSKMQLAFKTMFPEGEPDFTDSELGVGLSNIEVTLSGSEVERLCAVLEEEDGYYRISDLSSFLDAPVGDEQLRVIKEKIMKGMINLGTDGKERSSLVKLGEDRYWSGGQMALFEAEMMAAMNELAEPMERELQEEDEFAMRVEQRLEEEPEVFELQNAPNWGVEEVIVWLSNNGMHEYGKRFMEEGVNGDALLNHMNATQLQMLGVRPLHVSQMLRRVAELKRAVRNETDIELVAEVTHAIHWLDFGKVTDLDNLREQLELSQVTIDDLREQIADLSDENLRLMDVLNAAKESGVPIDAELAAIATASHSRMGSLAHVASMSSFTEPTLTAVMGDTTATRLSRAHSGANLSLSGLASAHVRVTSQNLLQASASPGPATGGFSSSGSDLLANGRLITRLKALKEEVERVVEFEDMLVVAATGDERDLAVDGKEEDVKEKEEDKAAAVGGDEEEEEEDGDGSKAESLTIESGARGSGKALAKVARFCSEENISEWNRDEVAYWVYSIRFPQYVLNFHRVVSDGDMLLWDVTPVTLREDLNVKAIHARRILQRVDALRRKVKGRWDLQAQQCISIESMDDPRVAKLKADIEALTEELESRPEAIEEEVDEEADAAEGGGDPVEGGLQEDGGGDAVDADDEEEAVVGDGGAVVSKEKADTLEAELESLRVEKDAAIEHLKQLLAENGIDVSESEASDEAKGSGSETDIDVEDIVERVKAAADSDPQYCDPSLVMDWTHDEVCYWLVQLQFDNYIEAFVKMGIDGSILVSDVDKEWLKGDLGVRKLHRTKILRQIEALRKHLPEAIDSAAVLREAEEKEAERFVELERELENERNQREAFELELAQIKKELELNNPEKLQAEIDSLEVVIDEERVTKVRTMRALNGELESLRLAARAMHLQIQMFTEVTTRTPMDSLASAMGYAPSRH